MADTTAAHPIVAGIDGSTSALNAAKWAAREAALRETSLLLVHACDAPAVNPRSPVSLPRNYADALREYGDDWLRDAHTAVTAAVSDVAPDLEVHTAVEDGHPAEVLINAAASAQLVVLGSRGLGGFSSLLIGSVAVAVAGHAPCPVVVVRGEEGRSTARDPVVVGVDGSVPGDRALGFAFEVAALRDAPLVAVRAWTYATIETGWPAVPMEISDDDIAGNERRLLDQCLAPWQEKYPEVSAEGRVVRGRPVRTLLAEGAHAQLIVVGSRGRGALAGLGLGSVSQGLLHHADRPVAIVRVRP
ncbi:universal stress protein [Haloechinothrix salitolerans]|uniref:Universal stress protein n=1 Tax=Haloechinothrix salitolerans TaxID=926830 RepID=A0ABW2C0Y4_9PSEU